ncbi:lasso peptide biosynthesis B2 protein [Runella aurantiaca]|uniref:Lasso peptide biosynthesis B2 protein n=1 Tax=Runella aurantiaca TaxID=2282308 RepID=A0A369I759_9BACT|nr:lasso peptide biosynthesis B2 protein [Runella aurantiaca]RDB04327.1 lasso peptide biosynthesis B2 protein [Runella aurantiaca]
MKQVIKFSKLPIQEKLLFVEALLFSYSAKVLLLILPFKYCLKFVSNDKCEDTEPDVRELKQIKKAVYRSNGLAFWDNKCLVMSLASRWMLQRRRIPSQISLGVAFDEKNNFIAHAWLKTFEYEIVDKGGNYRELYQF